MKWYHRDTSKVILVTGIGTIITFTLGTYFIYVRPGGVFGSTLGLLTFWVGFAAMTGVIAFIKKDWRS